VKAPLRALALAATLTLAACATRAPAPTPTPAPAPLPPPPATAREAGISLATPASISPADAERALAAFRASCPVLIRRQDQSGLTAAADWQSLCAEAASVPHGGAAAFFRDRFEWVRVGSGEAFATGYYEPEILGSRAAGPGFSVPIYKVPDDLVRCYGPQGTGRGRVDHEGYCVLYYTRAEIEDGALAGRGLELGWAADPIELFFLQIQGSGRIKLPDGQVMRIGYADQNGRDYVAIGRLLRDRGVLPPGGANMEAIVAWMRSQPDGGRSLMRENLSYIFFKELTGPGPLGALNVAVAARASVAADPKFVPLGAPVFLTLDRPEASGLWVAQDTGGAIKGANRFDTFWGAGDEARRMAGGMSAKGQSLILLPKGTVARAQAIP
jgi:membrane-bound lytic murein transglycosylase A